MEQPTTESYKWCSPHQITALAASRRDASLGAVVPYTNLTTYEDPTKGDETEAIDFGLNVYGSRGEVQHLICGRVGIHSRKQLLKADIPTLEKAIEEGRVLSYDDPKSLILGWLEKSASGTTFWTARLFDVKGWGSELAKGLRDPKLKDMRNILPNFPVGSLAELMPPPNEVLGLFHDALDLLPDEEVFSIPFSELTEKELVMGLIIQDDPVAISHAVYTAPEGSVPTYGTHLREYPTGRLRRTILEPTVMGDGKTHWTVYVVPSTYGGEGLPEGHYPHIPEITLKDLHPNSPFETMSDLWEKVKRRHKAESEAETSEGVASTKEVSEEVKTEEAPIEPLQVDLGGDRVAPEAPGPFSAKGLKAALENLVEDLSFEDLIGQTLLESDTIPESVKVHMEWNPSHGITFSVTGTTDVSEGFVKDLASVTFPLDVTPLTEAKISQLMAQPMCPRIVSPYTGTVAYVEKVGHKLFAHTGSTLAGTDEVQALFAHSVPLEHHLTTLFSSEGVHIQKLETLDDLRREILAENNALLSIQIEPSSAITEVQVTLNSLLQFMSTVLNDPNASESDKEQATSLQKPIQEVLTQTETSPMPQSWEEAGDAVLETIAQLVEGIEPVEVKVADMVEAMAAMAEEEPKVDMEGSPLLEDEAQESAPEAHLKHSNCELLEDIAPEERLLVYPNADVQRCFNAIEKIRFGTVIYLNLTNFQSLQDYLVLSKDNQVKDVKVNSDGAVEEFTYDGVTVCHGPTPYNSFLHSHTLIGAEGGSRLLTEEESEVSNNLPSLIETNKTLLRKRIRARSLIEGKDVTQIEFFDSSLIKEEGAVTNPRFVRVHFKNEPAAIYLTSYFFDLQGTPPAKSMFLWRDARKNFTVESLVKLQEHVSASRNDGDDASWADRRVGGIVMHPVHLKSFNASLSSAQLEMKDGLAGMCLGTKVYLSTDMIPGQFTVFECGSDELELFPDSYEAPSYNPAPSGYTLLNWSLNQIDTLEPQKSVKIEPEPEPVKEELLTTGTSWGHFPSTVPTTVTSPGAWGTVSTVGTNWGDLKTYWAKTGMFTPVVHAVEVPKVIPTPEPEEEDHSGYGALLGVFGAIAAMAGLAQSAAASSKKKAATARTRVLDAELVEGDLEEEEPLQEEGRS